MAVVGGIDKWNQDKAVKHFAARAALGMEGVMIEAWSDARQNHSFKNRTGQLEASIRVEKKKLPKGWVAYRLAAGTGGLGTGTDNFRPYSKGRPGGVRTTTSKGQQYDPKKPYYAVFVELGTRNMAAMSFLLQPILSRRNDFNAAMNAARTAGVLGGF